MSLPSRTRLAEEYLTKSLNREVQGLKTYGEFNPKTDTRTLSVEAQEEAIDVLSYLRLFERKFGRRDEVPPIKKLAFKLYVELRRLELVERTLNGG